MFQLVGIAALAVPINTFLATGHVASTQAVMASALVMGAGVASGALWFYSRRYVGELALLSGSQPGQPPRLRISVLDFWGKREVSERVCLSPGMLAGRWLLRLHVELPLASRHAPVGLGRRAWAADACLLGIPRWPCRTTTLRYRRWCHRCSTCQSRRGERCCRSRYFH